MAFLNQESFSSAWYQCRLALMVSLSLSHFHIGTLTAKLIFCRFK